MVCMRINISCIAWVGEADSFGGMCRLRTIQEHSHRPTRKSSQKGEACAYVERQIGEGYYELSKNV